jgi:integrase
VKEAISLQPQGGGQAAGGDVGEGNPRAIWRSNFTPIQVRAGRRLRRAALDGLEIGIVDEPGKQAQGQTFSKAIAAVDGCADVRLHDMRHTCASLAIRSGANVKVVQKLLGHKTATLTLDRYGHLYPDDLDAVATAFDTAADALRTIPTLNVVVSVGK